MADPHIRFNDGAGYERMMGAWSRLAAEVFFEWLAPGPRLRWIDVGCGSGAITEFIAQRCAPAEIQGIDPSEAQLAFARERPTTRMAAFTKGDAMELPFVDGRFDAAVMALVIFFVPDPARGVAEMVRVVAPGGLVAAYAWDIPGGGFPLQPIQSEMSDMGIAPLRPPSVDASRLEALRALWLEAGLDDVEIRQIPVQRTFADFEDYWSTSLLASSVGPAVAAMPPADAALLKSRLRARLPADAAGRVTCDARANAIKGRVPVRRR